jgi:hypothetical protein
MLALVKDLGKFHQKITKLVSNKEATYCKMSHCSKEMVALQQKLTRDL